MVKRIQQVIIILLLASILCGTAFAAGKDVDYTSPYYSDTSNLEEQIIIDRLYEYGLMDGIIAPQKEERGVFGSEDVVTNVYFYTIMNRLIGSDLSTKSKGVITHQQAILVFKRMANSCDFPSSSKEYDIPQSDDKTLTKLELAKWIYSFAKLNLLSEGEKIAEMALEYLGSNYVWGATGPSAFDCSGFTQYIMKQNGYNISRTCDTQYYDGEYVAKEDLQPGDIVLFGNCSHAGIYIGNSYFIHAANSRLGVIVTSLDNEYYAAWYNCGRRICSN